MGRGRGTRLRPALALVVTVGFGVLGVIGAATDRVPWVTSAAVSTIPPQLRLPNEGEPSTDPDLTDWTTDGDRERPWLIDPCRPTAYPTDARRTDFRTVSRTGPELFQARQLAVYPTPEVAAEVMAGFRRVLTACRTVRRDAYGGRLQWVSDLDVRVGDEAVTAASSLTTMPGGDRLTVTRVGTMVFLAYDGGEYGTAELDEGAWSTRRVAEAFVEGR